MKSIKYQRGFSFLGFIFIAAAFVAVAIFGMKLIPAYMHNAEINHIFKEIASDQAMKNAPVKEIKESYRKRAIMDNITDVSAEDIDINTGDGGLSLSAKYSVKIPLAGNITLLLDFNPSSS